MKDEIDYKEDYKILQAQVLQFFNILRKEKDNYWTYKYKKHFDIIVATKGEIK